MSRLNDWKFTAILHTLSWTTAHKPKNFGGVAVLKSPHHIRLGSSTQHHEHTHHVKSGNIIHVRGHIQIHRYDTKSTGPLISRALAETTESKSLREPVYAAINAIAQNRVSEQFKTNWNELKRSDAMTRSEPIWTWTNQRLTQMKEGNFLICRAPASPLSYLFTGLRSKTQLCQS